MPDPNRPHEERKISCSECQKEIPASEALSSEAVDYVQNFCGIECMDKWRKRQKVTPGGAADKETFSR